MTKTYLKTLATYHQNTRRSRFELYIYLLQIYRTYRNEKLLGYVKEGIKACINQFKVRKTRSEN